MSTEQCTSGLHRVALALVGAMIMAFAIGCGEADCPDGQDLITLSDAPFDGEERCAAPCDDGECADGETCTGGYCVPDIDCYGDDHCSSGVCDEDTNMCVDCLGDEDCDGDDSCVENECVECTEDGDCDGDATCEENQCVEPQCDAEAACTDYCYERIVRCMEEDCENPEIDQGMSLTDVEMDLCMNGMADQQGNQTIMGCVDEAQVESVCEQRQQEAEQYAQESCDQQESRICTEMLSSRQLIDGYEYFDACDCQPAKTAESCESDDECDEYGLGVCFEGECTAFCDDYDGNPPAPIWYDPYCGGDDLGMCFYPSLLQGQQQPQSIGQCVRTCTELDDCPEETYCYPALSFLDDQGEPSGESLGFCGDLSDGDDFEHCGHPGDEECPEGYGCFEGTCFAECTEDDDCEEGRSCSDDDLCAPDYQEF